MTAHAYPSLQTPTLILTPSDETISFDDFLQHYADERYEWSQGEIEAMSPIHECHDELSEYLYILLKTYLGLRGIGKVRREPFLIHRRSCGSQS
jgi:Uma2 family endonuclease